MISTLIHYIYKVDANGLISFLPDLIRCLPEFSHKIFIYDQTIYNEDSVWHLQFSGADVVFGEPYNIQDSIKIIYSKELLDKKNKNYIYVDYSNGIAKYDKQIINFPPAVDDIYFSVTNKIKNKDSAIVIGYLPENEKRYDDYLFKILLKNLDTNKFKFLSTVKCCKNIENKWGLNLKYTVISPIIIRKNLLNIDVLIYTLKKAPYYGRLIYEAAAFNVPVIAYKLKPYCNIFDDNSIIYFDKNNENNIYKILNNKTKIISIGNNAKIKGRQLCLRNYVNNFKKLLLNAYEKTQ